MSQIVRRVKETLITDNAAGDSLPERIHPGNGISVRSRLSLGIDPKLRIAWNVDVRYWHEGYTLMVFHSTSSFSPKKYPDDLNLHGQLIIEATHDAERVEHPPEGTHFYTFVLHKPGFLGLWETNSLVRFSETIPTAKIAIGRLEDKRRLEDLLQRHELDEIEYEVQLNDAKIRLHHSRQKLAQLDKPAKAPASRAEALIAEELAGIEAILLAFSAKRQKVEELKQDPRFTKLSKPEQKTVLKEIEDRLDAAEISARREMHKS
jgi:hypothetical protein